MLFRRSKKGLCESLPCPTWPGHTCPGFLLFPSLPFTIFLPAIPETSSFPWLFPPFQKLLSLSPHFNFYLCHYVAPRQFSSDLFISRHADAFSVSLVLKLGSYFVWTFIGSPSISELFFRALPLVLTRKGAKVGVSWVPTRLYYCRKIHPLLTWLSSSSLQIPSESSTSLTSSESSTSLTSSVSLTSFRIPRIL